MFMCAHVYGVALCGNTVKNVALGLWLVGHFCTRYSKVLAIPVVEVAEVTWHTQQKSYKHR